MEIRTFIHESIVKNGRKYFVSPTLDGSVFLATPEEYVRQDVIRTLHEDYGYPYNLMVMETKLDDNRRIDLMVQMPSTEVDPENIELSIPFSGGFIFYIIVECKKSTEPLNDDHVKQGLDYAHSCRPDYLIVTNGNASRCYQITHPSQHGILHREVPDIPKFSDALKESWIPKDFDSNIWNKWWEYLKKRENIEAEDCSTHEKYKALETLKKQMEREFPDIENKKGKLKHHQGIIDLYYLILEERDFYHKLNERINPPKFT